MFPGQGSQEVGMGRDLFPESPLFCELMEEGSDLTGEDLKSLCLRGPEKKLRRSFFLQPILVSVSLGYRDCLVRQGITADVILGHSLGEITALAAAGVVSPEVAVRIAAKRGALMDDAASHCDGGMLAVLSVPVDDVRALLKEMGDPDQLTVANDNAPGQLILSGASDMLAQFAERAAAQKMGRCKRLSVSGPWHSPLMKDARVAFEEWIAGVPFLPPANDLLLNATGQTETEPEEIRHLISRQLTSPVLWRNCMATLAQMGPDRLLEIGPGRVLSGLARLNGLGGDLRVFNINNLRGIKRVCE